MLRLAFDFIITWRETRTRPNAYVLTPFWANDFAAAKTMCSFTTVLSILFFLTLFILNIKGDKDTFIL